MIRAVGQYSSVRQHGIITISIILLTLLPAACKKPPKPAPEPTLAEIGERIFLTETFAGNGRTCGTCHRPTDNFGLTPSFIASLDDDDPLFVAETNPDLASNFENPVLMREFAMILENQDGFDNLENNFNMRGVPHTLALPTSIESRDGPRTGWSGDGAPGDGSLRAFATGAVIQAAPVELQLTPNARTVVVTTKGGGVHAGTLRKETKDTLTIQPLEGEAVTVQVADVTSRSQPVSAMPPVGAILTKRQLETS